MGEQQRPWRLKDMLRGTWKGLTLGTDNPWVAGGTTLMGLGGLGYLLGPSLIRRLNPSIGLDTQNLRGRGLAAGLIGGTLLAGIPAALNWYGASRRQKTAGWFGDEEDDDIGRKYVPYNQAQRNIAEQDTMDPNFKFDFSKAVDNASTKGPSGLVPLTSIAKGLMGFGFGRLGSALGGALIGANMHTQKTLNTIGGWAGAASAIPGLIDWSR